MFPHHFFPVYFFVVGKPENYVPTFQAHRVEVAPHTFNRLKYQVEDSSGDGVVFQITNNGHLPVHICLVSYQSDGSIFVLYPTANRASHFFWFCFIIRHCALLYRKKVFTSSRRTFFRWFWKDIALLRGILIFIYFQHTKLISRFIKPLVFFSFTTSSVDTITIRT